MDELRLSFMKKTASVIFVGIIAFLSGCEDKSEVVTQIPAEKCTGMAARDEDSLLHQTIIGYLQEYGCVVFANPEYMKGKALSSGDIQYVVLRKDGAAVVSEAAVLDVYNSQDSPYMTESIDVFSWKEVDQIMCGQEISDHIPLPFFRAQGGYWLASMRSIPNAGCELGCRVAESFRIHKTDPQCVPLKMIDPGILRVMQQIGSVVADECRKMNKVEVPEEPSLPDMEDREQFKF